MKKAFIVLIIILLAGAGVLYFWLQGITNKIFIPGVKVNPASTNTIQQSLDNKKSINIVLLGYN